MSNDTYPAFSMSSTANSDVEARLPEYNISELPEILTTPTDERLLREQIRQIDGNKVKRVAILSFRSLQLYRIAKLQAELIKKQNTLMNTTSRRYPLDDDERKKFEDFSENEDKEIDEMLQRYVDAVRNYEVLSRPAEFHKDVSYDFLGGKQQFKVIGRANTAHWDVPQWLVRGNPKFGTLPPYRAGPLGFRELDSGSLPERHIMERLKSRLHMALFGGVALIAPVLVMTLWPGLGVDLVTASVATAIFALIMVVFATDASGKDVLTSTAAYAAVMVVFVGTSLQTMGGQ